jgi:phosphate:Na+ symporter
MQSSTAVTVLTISFVNAGWISFSQSLGIILGTNVGTTLTTELMGFKLHKYGWAVLAAAFFGWLWTAAMNEIRNHGAAPRGISVTLRYVSAALAGFGLLLIGFDVLLSMGGHLQNSALFMKLMNTASEQPLAVLLGSALMTAMVHSSAAVIGMAMAAAGSGLMSLDAGIAIVLGANIGTCFTGLAASLSGGPGGQFTALSQLALNIGGALLFLPLTPLLAAASVFLAPGNPAAQIAHAQTIFNLVCSLAALPLAYWPGWEKIRD